MAFEIIFAFDEAIALGHNENVTIVQIKQYCEMESHEERLHKLVLQSKIDETKDVMKRKASEIDKIKVLCGLLYFPDLQVTRPCLEMLQVLFSCFTPFLIVM